MRSVPINRSGLSRQVLAGRIGRVALGIGLYLVRVDGGPGKAQFGALERLEFVFREFDFAGQPLEPGGSRGGGNVIRGNLVGQVLGVSPGLLISMPLRDVVSHCSAGTSGVEGR